jgi:hypothetical protein
MYDRPRRIVRPYGDRHAINDAFEVTRVRKDQQSSRQGLSVLLRFSVIGPPGVHPVKVKVTRDTGACPGVTHDRDLALDDGATGYVNVSLDFDHNSPEPCTMSILVGGRVLGRFLVEPSNTR